ncbi:MAG: hypothetical protein C6I00_02815 [Nitratiruptor sp.]|nr:hypothetical protein [Nitratiruptor sp.]
MAKIDEVKEEIAFLKVWLGILVVTLFGMVDQFLLVMDFVGILILSGVVLKLNFAIIEEGIVNGGCNGVSLCYSFSHRHSGYHIQ